MPFYLTKRSFPELEMLPPAERDAVWRVARRNVFRRWELWLALGLFVVAAYAVLMLLQQLQGGPTVRAARILMAATFGGIGGLTVTQVGIRLMRPYFRAELEARQRRD